MRAIRDGGGRLALALALALAVTLTLTLALAVTLTIILALALALATGRGGGLSPRDTQCPPGASREQLARSEYHASHEGTNGLPTD